MEEGLRSGLSRYALSIALSVAALALIACATLALLPRTSDTSAPGIGSLKELAAAYLRVQPGQTRTSQLSQLGFDTTTPGVEALSYLGVMERFMTGDSTKFDRLDVALQNCIAAQDRCTAFVFRPGDQAAENSSGLLSGLGFGAANAADRVAEVTLLVLNGRVAYKRITGVTLPSAPVRHFAAPTLPRQAALVQVSYPMSY